MFFIVSFWRGYYFMFKHTIKHLPNGTRPRTPSLNLLDKADVEIATVLSMPSSPIRASLYTLSSEARTASSASAMTPLRCLNNSFFKTPGKPPKALTPITEEYSDHAAVVYGSSIGWNTMMPEKNAFGKQEISFDYTCRMANVLGMVALLKEQHPQHAIFFGAELPIDGLRRFTIRQLQRAFNPQGSDEERGTIQHTPDDGDCLDDGQVFIDCSDWGVGIVIDYALLNSTSPKRITTITDGTTTPKLSTRVRTYELTSHVTGENLFITSFHLPHANPENACHEVATNIFSHLIHRQNGQHWAGGDSNLAPHDIEAIFKSCYEKFIINNPDAPPCNVDITYDWHPNTHLKRNGEYKSVDGKLRISCMPSLAHQYSFTHNAPLEESLIEICTFTQVEEAEIAAETLYSPSFKI